MPDEFKEVTTTGLGGRFVDSLKKIVVGLILFIVSFGVLFWNEGRIDVSKIARNAVEISASKSENADVQNGKLVSVSGVMATTSTVGDDLFLKPDAYLTLARTVEVYAWKESQNTTSKKNLGGSETTETTYSYAKEWTNDPEDSSSFKYPADHQNSEKRFENGTFQASVATIGDYTVDTASIEWPPLNPIKLTDQNVNLVNGATLAGDTYLFIGAVAGSTITNPVIGDTRISYKGLNSGASGTVLGKLSASSIVPFMGKSDTKIYQFFAGTKDEAVAAMHTQYTTSTWLLRLVGFLIMWFGLMMMVDVASVLLDVLPMLGTVSRSIVGVITFVIALLLSVVTIIISSVVHSLIALVLLLVVAIVVALVLMKKKKRRK